MTCTKRAFHDLMAAYQAAGSSVYFQVGAADDGTAPDMGGSDYAGYDVPADGKLVKCEVMERR